MTPQLYIAFACGLSLLLFLMAYEVKPEDRSLVEAYARGCRALGYGVKHVAGFQGLNESQWKRQYNAEPGQHVSAYRLCASPDDVMRQTIRELAPVYRLRVIDERDAVLPLIAEAKSLVDTNRELIRLLGAHNYRSLFIGQERESA